ncbi:unnamed protein product [Heligmosomoides polygyrus]|uniref:phosphoacetylglucosamine mutase n=1 Tax=Heligmosomoides polygyrus TaxID=6339 RepID=A0A3P8BFC7_HELPZ|nr:unnamed protein product [Heligmosomoides polygyrus]
MNFELIPFPSFVFSFAAICGLFDFRFSQRNSSHPWDLCISLFPIRVFRFCMQLCLFLFQVSSFLNSGTAGFRYSADLLPFVVFRMGYLAGLRARELNQTIGVMITASHNPAKDNGVKIVDPMGEMLAAEWEKYASELVNASDEQLPTAVRALEVQVGIYQVWSGGVEFSVMEQCPITLGLLTTPQLHYIVRCKNDPSFGEAREIGYYARLTDAFKALLKVGSNYSPNLVLDCANGVGGEKMRMLCRFVPEGSLRIQFRNEDGVLNHECGADYIKIGQVLPTGFDDVDVKAKCASFDGDADRLIYFSALIVLLDGDIIAVLLAKYIKETLEEAGIDDLSIGVVQTAYANGNSTRYLKDGITPVFVPTGVKHLHHAAMKFDIGIYFEANGHGTVVFSDKFDKLIRRCAFQFSLRNLFSEKKSTLIKYFSRVVGDAIADLLAVESLLRWYGLSVEDWERSLYTNAPSVQLKVPVTDRSIYKTTYEETTLLEPAGVQEKIDALVEKHHEARAFVRSSGTENIVRVYAEAQTPDEGRGQWFGSFRCNSVLHAHYNWIC